MNTFLAWAEAHQAGLIAISAVITALATAVLAWLTGTLVGENRRLRKAGTEPDVVAYLLPDERAKMMINLVISNIGQGPARDVIFSFEDDQRDFVSHNVQISNNPARQAISVLPQGEKMVAYFGRGPDLHRNPRLKPFEVKIDYKDLTGKRCSRKSRLDVSQFDGLLSLGTPADHEMAEALKKIAAEVVRWSSNSRLKVNVVTQKGEEQAHKDWLDREYGKHDPADS